MKINNTLIKNLFYKTLRIRSVELEISKRYAEKKMRCPIHLSVGQESVAVGVCENLKKSEIVNKILQKCKKDEIIC